MAFAYSIDLSQVSRPGVVEASPMSGKVAAGDKAKIKLKVANHTVLSMSGGCHSFAYQLLLVSSSKRASAQAVHIVIVTNVFNAVSFVFAGEGRHAGSLDGACHGLSGTLHTRTSASPN